MGPRDPFPSLPIDSDAPELAPGPLHFRPTALAAVALGGFVGAMARYELGVFFVQSGTAWPITTFTINVSGAFFLGLLLEALVRSGPDSRWRQQVRLGVGTGALGSFTTYSTLAVDTDLLVREHQMWAALTYAGISVLAGLVATASGIAVGAQVTLRRGKT